MRGHMQSLLGGLALLECADIAHAIPVRARSDDGDCPLAPCPSGQRGQPTTDPLRAPNSTTRTRARLWGGTLLVGQRLIHRPTVDSWKIPRGFSEGRFSEINESRDLSRGLSEDRANRDSQILPARHSFRESTLPSAERPASLPWVMKTRR